MFLYSMKDSTPDHDLAQLLRSRGQRVTSQRLLVHRILRRQDAHLSAEQVFTQARAKLPGTSLPTIYATLDLFVELGLARRVPTSGRATLYDSRVEPHAHTVCRLCGGVADLECDGGLEPVQRAALRSGFAAEQVQALVDGVCDSCAADRAA
jgi:Fe2+ or Zn2+ uptake regulation protein